jgi:hypothetical protein
LCTDLFRGLCPHGGEELLGGRSCRAEFLLTALCTLRGETLSAGLGLGQDPLRLFLCRANDVGRGGLQAGLIDDRGRFCARGLAKLLRVLTGLREQRLALLAPA